MNSGHDRPSFGADRRTDRTRSGPRPEDETPRRCRRKPSACECAMMNPGPVPFAPRFEPGPWATRVSLDRHRRLVPDDSTRSSVRDDPGQDHAPPLRDGVVLGIALALLLDSLIGPAASLLLFTGVVAAHARSRDVRPGLL